MAMVGGSIVKVECRACGSVHKYRPAGASLPARAEAPVRRGRDGTIITPPRPAPRSAASKQPKPARPSVLYEQWQTVLRRRELETPLPYSLTASFSETSLVEHPVFGLGQVLSIIPPDKMDVLFEDGIRRLKCG